MPLTIREKDHWRERITRKIDQAIEALYAVDNPTFREDVRKQARKLAYESLGIAELKTQLDTIDEEKKALDEKRTNTLRTIKARLGGKDVDDVPHYVSERDINSMVTKREKFHFQEVLQTTELGRKVLKLEHEKEELLDTVWLATSTTQIKQLWQTVSDVLKQQPTELQKEALRIEPVAEDNK